MYKVKKQFKCIRSKKTLQVRGWTPQPNTLYLIPTVVVAAPNARSAVLCPQRPRRQVDNVAMCEASALDYAYVHFFPYMFQMVYMNFSPMHRRSSLETSEIILSHQLDTPYAEASSRLICRHGLASPGIHVMTHCFQERAIIA
jgi:hypothetical protein